jgi:DNA ligase-associated metallophosphoesterase
MMSRTGNHKPSSALSSRGALTFEFKGERLVLCPGKALWWPNKQMLVVSDLHLGKASHFRKNGIALPQQTNTDNLYRLADLLMDFQPQTLLLLGDLFHSEFNAEWDVFHDFLQNFPEVSTILVKGNHDILPDALFEQAGLKVVDQWDVGPFRFVHEPLEIPEDDIYHITGHIHPAVVLQGAARQRLRLPCYWWGANQAVMPAFGYFTGSHRVKPKKGDHVHVIAENCVLEV